MPMIRHRFPVAALVIALSIAACSKEPAQDYLQSARDYLGRKDNAAAIIQLKNAVREQPESAEVRYLLGAALRDASDPSAAEIELRKALALGYDANAVLPHLSHVLLEMGQYDKAMQEIEGASITDAKVKAELTALKGEALAGKGKIEEARAAYQEALALEAGNPVAKVGMARLALVGNDTAQAEAALDEVLSSRPDTADGWALKAGILTRQGKMREAAEAYEKVIALRPADVRAFTGLVPIILSLDGPEASGKVLARLAKAAPNTPATAYLDALVSFAKGDKLRARGSIQLALKAVPDDIRAQLLGGSIEHDLGNYAMAEKLLSAVVNAAPSEQQPRRLLASAQLRAGQAARAKQTLGPLLDAAPNDPGVLLLAAEIAEALREPQKALAYLEKAASLDQKNVASRIALGRARIRMGRAEQGIADLEAASKANPTDPTPDLLLVEYFIKQGKPDRARSTAASLSQRQPEQPQGHNALGLAHLASRQMREARAAFEKALSVAPAFFPAAKNLAAMDLEEGKPDAAKERYRAVLSRDPKQAEAALLLAAVMQRTGSPAADVLKTLDDSIAINLTSVPLRMAKIDYLMATGDNKAALEAATAAQASITDDTTVVFALARAQQMAGELRQATVTYNKLASLSGDSVVPHMGLAEVQVADKNWEAARTSLRKAIEIKPEHLPAYLAMVDVSVRAGNFDAAREDARAIQRKWPDRTTGYVAEAQVLAASKDAMGGEKILRAAMSKLADADLIGALYRNLLAQSRAEEAEKEMNAWLGKHPGDLRAMLAAADTRLAREEYKPAEQWYRRVLERKPDHPVVLNNMAWVLGKLNDPSALEFGRKALEKAPRSAALLDTVGMLNVQFGKVDEGIRQLQSAVAQSPRAVSIRVNLARALAKAGKKEEALKELDSASKYGVGEPLAREIEELRKSI